jgi:hypothetical protein
MNETQKLIEYFKTATLPPPPIQLDKATIIYDINLLVKNHLKAIVNIKNENYTKGYIQRLKSLKSIIEEMEK